jgi:hypothetical protein
MAGYQRYRAKFHHLILIDQAIREGRFPNSHSLAPELEVCDRTVRRNIRSELAVPGTLTRRK